MSTTLFSTATRQAYWPSVEQWISHLPSQLQSQMLQVKAQMTLEIDTGLFSEICSDVDAYPHFDLPLWVLQDWHQPKSRTQLAQASCYLTFAATIIRWQQESYTAIDDSFAPLADLLYAEAKIQLGQIVPNWLALKPQVDRVWANHIAAQQWYRRRCQVAEPWQPADFDCASQRMQASLIPAMAAAHLSVHTHQIEALTTCLGHLHQAHTIRDMLLTMRRDLPLGLKTPPILQTLQKMDFPLTDTPEPSAFIGFMLLQRTADPLLDCAQQQLTYAQQGADDLQLPTLTTYIEVFSEVIEELRQLLSLQPSSTDQSLRNRFAPVIEIKEKALRIAEDYLLADLTFAEAWDVQPRYLPNGEDLVGCVFPKSFILEQLIATGHNLTNQVDELYPLWCRISFSYFEGRALAPDIDDIGIACRLWPVANQPAAVEKKLQQALGWAYASQTATGEQPVYLTEGEGAPYLPDNIYWGDRCLPTQLNFLLGVLRYPNAEPALSASLLNTTLNGIVQHGLVPLSYYTLPYTVWAAALVVAEILDHTKWQAWHSLAKQVKTIIFQQWQMIEADNSPQTAALLVLAAVAGGWDISAAWITTMLKQQRYDGGWPAEPLYTTCGRGGQVNWYRSRLATTALCYRALLQNQ